VAACSRIPRQIDGIDCFAGAQRLAPFLRRRHPAQRYDVG
jgi:glyoxylate/hydroxypyruvate reductase A